MSRCTGKSAPISALRRLLPREDYMLATKVGNPMGASRTAGGYSRKHILTAVDERVRDVRTMFDSPRLDQALPLLRKYGVSYIYVGGLERIYYSAAGLQKFELPSDLLKTEYSASGVTIYWLNGAQ